MDNSHDEGATKCRNSYSGELDYEHEQLAKGTGLGGLDKVSDIWLGQGSRATAVAGLTVHMTGRRYKDTHPQSVAPRRKNAVDLAVLANANELVTSACSPYPIKSRDTKIIPICYVTHAPGIPPFLWKDAVQTLNRPYGKYHQDRDQQVETAGPYSFCMIAHACKLSF